MSDDSSLIKSSTLMAVGTLLSRITGLIRGLLIVAVLGTALLGDSYNVGNTTPNIIYNLLIGGALTAVFVPQIVRSFRDSDGGSAFISKLTSLIGTMIFIVTVIAMLIAPLLVTIYAPTFSGRTREITIAFTLFCLPQVLFYGLFGVLGQITNAKERFGPMMWSPIANNLVVIALFGYFLANVDGLTTSNITDQQVLLMGLGTTAGIVIQAGILIPYIRGSGIELRLRFDWRKSGLGKSVRLGGWTLLSVLISQLGFLVTVNLATRSGVSALESGVEFGAGYTPYANAYLILMLPHSIATISVVTAILPRLSRAAIDGDHSSFTTQLRTAIRLIAVITAPAALFFLVFGELIGSTLFFGIDSESASYLGRVLSAFALGAIPLAINLVGVRALNAFENTRFQFYTTLFNNVIAIALSILAYLVLEPEQVVIGLAAAFAASYWVSVIYTDYLLKRYTGSFTLSRELPFNLKVALIAALAVAAAAFLFQSLELPGNILTLLIVLAITSLLYLIFARIFRVAEVNETVAAILRR